MSEATKNDNILYLLGQISGKLDHLAIRQAEDRETTRRLEDRVAKLEKWRWGIMGAAGFAGSGASVLYMTVFGGA